MASHRSSDIIDTQIYRNLSVKIVNEMIKIIVAMLIPSL